jgi:hypothetical protein
MPIEDTTLWRRSIGSASDSNQPGYERLRTALRQARHRVAQLTAKISTTLPNLTIHDASHLDALWETADIIAGNNYPLNPMEGFVFGGAVLLHDAGLCFDAYEGGQDAVRATLQWRDAFAGEKARSPKKSDSEIEAWADFAALRELHASQAALLAERAWTDPDTKQQLFLFDDPELRKRYGSIIGLIASSHHWAVEEVESKLPNQINAYADFPADWRIDPVKLACLLRCADAAHIDSRRAPDFLHALTRREGISLSHWQAQNWLARFDLDVSDQSLQTGMFTSNREFQPADFDAWWVANDAIALVDREIRASNGLLQSRSQCNSSPPFQIKRIAGVDSPEQMSKHLRARGWKPWSAQLQVGNVESLVRRLGGETLYGKNTDHLQTVLRELIQNSRDAVAARRSLDKSYTGKIKIRLMLNPTSSVLEVEDDGIGMSERVLTGPLLDFGNSFWASDLVKEEFPGLRSSQFKSVGQFGIGFFSIFMISDDVKVRSRRWDRGLESVCELAFPKGLTLRPIVSIGNAKGFSGYTSTIVNCRLKREISENALTKKLNSGYVGGTDILVDIPDYLAALVPGLDVEVELQLDDGEPLVIHRPISETIEEARFSEWLSAISFLKYRSAPSANSLTQISSRLRPIESKGSLAGLAALTAQEELGLNLRGVTTIGGLATNFNLRTERGFVGFMEVEANSAKRDGNQLIAEQSDVAKWAQEQIDILKAQQLDTLGWCYVTLNLTRLDLDPTNVLHAMFLRGRAVHILNLQQIMEAMENEPIALFKSNFADVIDSHIGARPHEGNLTFVSLANSKFLSLKMQNGVSEDHNSLIGCLERRAREHGKALAYEQKKNVARSLLGAIDVLLVRTIPA